MSYDGPFCDNGHTSVITDTGGEGILPRVGSGEPAAHAIRKALLTGNHWLRHNDPAARQGEVEGVHRMRTAARRLRSNLRLFRPLLGADWAERLALELRWLGQVLGA